MSVCATTNHNDIISVFHLTKTPKQTVMTFMDGYFGTKQHTVDSFRNKYECVACRNEQTIENLLDVKCNGCFIRF